MKPALTAEEWAEGVQRLGDVPDALKGTNPIYRLMSLGLIVQEEKGPEGSFAYGHDTVALFQEDCHAIAALALQRAGPDGGPLFTWEDVDDERAELKGLEGQLRGWLERSARQALQAPEKENFERLKARARRKRSRVARLASLLPPREEG